MANGEYEKVFEESSNIMPLFTADQIGNTSTEILSDNGNGNNTITVTMEPGSDQQTITVNGQQTGQQHVLTTNSDGSLSISGLPGHIIGSLGNVSCANGSIVNGYSFDLLNFRPQSFELKTASKSSPASWSPLTSPRLERRRARSTASAPLFTT